LSLRRRYVSAYSKLWAGVAGVTKQDDDVAALGCHCWNRDLHLSADQTKVGRKRVVEIEVFAARGNEAQDEHASDIP